MDTKYFESGDDALWSTFLSFQFLAHLSSFVHGIELAPPCKREISPLPCVAKEVLSNLLQPDHEEVDHECDIIHDGLIEWSKVHITSSLGKEEAITEGSRLARLCHINLSRNDKHYRHEVLLNPARGLLPFGSAMLGVYSGIVHQSGEKLFVAFLVCLTILEKALYSIHKESRSTKESGPCRCFEEVRGELGGVSQCRCGIGPSFGAAESPMILRDLLRTEELLQALPPEMMAVLRLLLLPEGFNIRNLVWHGFLAPSELPMEFVSLALMITMGIADIASRRRTPINHLPSFPQPQDVTTSKANSLCNNGTTSFSDITLCEDQPQDYSVDELKSQKQTSLPRTLLCKNGQGSGGPSCPSWSLDSHNDVIQCPASLIQVVSSLLWHYEDELGSLVRRSAFVVPGREGLVESSFVALREGRSLLFVITLVPVIEHGLRCLFSCVNSSPSHLYAQERQYYTTLDGFGQRAKHQLLLDQYLNCDQGKPNLLLKVLGQGISACLLDLFMMEAGPGLRGKVAHGETDLSGVYDRNISKSSSHKASETHSGDGLGGVVTLLAAVFITLCHKYDPNADASAYADLDIDPEHGSDAVCDKSLKFQHVLSQCDSHCSGWVSRFHPHELLEADMQECLLQCKSLNKALDMRHISCTPLPCGSFAVMSVVVDQGPTILANNKRGSAECLPSSMVNTLELSITDAAHRLMPSQRQDAGSGKEKTVGGGQANTTSVFPVLERIRSALRENDRNLAKRFASTELYNRNGRDHASALAHHRMSCSVAERFCPCGQSAFAVHLHSDRCRDREACRLECLDPLWAEGITAIGTRDCSKSEEAFSSAKNMATLYQMNDPVTACTSTAMAGEGRLLVEEEDEICCSNLANDIIGRHPQRQGSLVLQWQGLIPSFNQQERCTQLRVPWHPPQRISPITKVTSVATLPQIGCMQSLCRACTTLVANMHEVLQALEAQMATGKARTAQRRTYAATLYCAPVMLSFLAVTLASIEAFVIEWDAQEYPSAVSPSSQLGGDHLMGLPPHNVLQNVLSAAGRPEVPPPVESVCLGGCEKGHESRRKEGALAAAAVSMEANTGKLSPSAGTHRNGSDGWDRRQAFIRRLSAIVGTLGLCVPNAGVNSRESGSAGNHSGGGTRKGYVQALTELALFLESRTAREGFGGGRRSGV